MSGEFAQVVLLIPAVKYVSGHSKREIYVNIRHISLITVALNFFKIHFGYPDKRTMVDGTCAGGESYAKGMSSTPFEVLSKQQDAACKCTLIQFVQYLIGLAPSLKVERAYLVYVIYTSWRFRL